MYFYFLYIYIGPFFLFFFCSHLPADRDHDGPRRGLGPSHAELVLRRAQEVLRRIAQGNDARSDDVARAERLHHLHLVHFRGANILLGR